MRSSQILAAVAALAAITLTSGCGRNDRAAPLPPVSSSPRTPTSSPTHTTPAWESKYTKAELAAYRLALGRYTAYDKASAPIWEMGKISDAARQVFDEYTFDHGQGEIPQLEFDQVNGVGAAGLPAKVLDSEATRIKLSGGGGSITIRQCADYSKVKGLQHGQVTHGGAYGAKKPQVRIVRMEKLPATRWGLFSVKESLGDKPCKP